MTATLRVFPTAGELAAAAADEVVHRLRDAVVARGRASLVLAGGSTPMSLYQLLAARADDPTVPWSAVDWFWGDERTVPPEHPESNFGAAWSVWLSKLPIAPERLHRIEGELPAEEAAARYEREIRRALSLGPAELPRFDLVLLGLGTDGHTASLFPGSPALSERQRLVAAPWVAKLGSHRLTLTYPALNSARAVHFLVAGAEKAEVLAQVMRGPFQPDLLPAQGVRPERGELHWWLDEEAAGTLDRTPTL